jgi:hypothetical protein
LTGDLGAGRFDGAWLVQNFENLDPANTLWSKQYNLYANVDSEGPRYWAIREVLGRPRLPGTPAKCSTSSTTCSSATS